ncbi:MAG: hypothetical protein AAGD17_06485 [Bacteroidota bacterium]
MKKALVLFLSIYTLACSNDDTNESGDNALGGDWTLTNVVCFCGFPDTPEFELTTLTFNTNRKEVEVLSAGSFMYFKDNGIYPYTEEGNRITLQDGSAYDFTISGNTLTLEFVDERFIADDEILYTLTRN